MLSSTSGSTRSTRHTCPRRCAAPPINGQIVGYVYLRDQQGAPLPNGQGQAPVLRDPLTGELSYTFTNLAPGTYRLQAFTAYKGDDQVTRIYKMLFRSNYGYGRAIAEHRGGPERDWYCVTWTFYLNIEGDGLSIIWISKRGVRNHGLPTPRFSRRFLCQG